MLDALGGLPFTPSRLVFWQPALDGRRFLDQFLRLAVTGAMAKGVAGASVAGFRNQLAAGEVARQHGRMRLPNGQLHNRQWWRARLAQAPLDALQSRQ